MPNEGSYGGKIEVRKNGSVLWQVAAREFPKDRDTDGSLEYAIRVATSERTSFTSRDGKCLININAQASNLNVQGVGADKAKFLIVSGYETPDVPYNTVPVGRSYFITYARHVEGMSAQRVAVDAESLQKSGTPGGLCDDETEQSRHEHDQNHHTPAGPPFTYDLSLRYDDYDLDRAGLPFDLDPDRLEVCYQNFVSLKEVYRRYYCKRNELLAAFREKIGAAQSDRKGLRDDFKTTDECLTYAIVWTLTYRHLRALGISRDLIDDLEHLILPWDETERDVVYARWLSVGAGAANAAAHHTPASGSQRRFQLDITPDDVTATPGFPIIAVASENILAVAGSRTITLRGLNQPGTFILMYHGDIEHYDRRERPG